MLAALDDVDDLYVDQIATVARFKDAAARDVDAVMTKIDNRAVSYEQIAPLQYVGADAIREVSSNPNEEAKRKRLWARRMIRRFSRGVGARPLVV